MPRRVVFVSVTGVSSDTGDFAGAETNPAAAGYSPGPDAPAQPNKPNNPDNIKYSGMDIHLTDIVQLHTVFHRTCSVKCAERSIGSKNF